MYINPEILTQFQTFSLGPFTFYGYGIIIGVAITVSLFLFLEIVPKSLRDSSHFYRNIALVIVAAIIGGRLFHVISIPGTYTSISEMIAIWDGGTTIFGVLIGGLVGLILSHVLDRSFKTILIFSDYAVPSVAIGQAIGRWANFINQELYGTPTDLPWKMFIAPQNRLTGYEVSEFFHPTFLYESILNLISGLTLLWLLKKKTFHKKTPGIITGLYFVCYGTIRIVMERFRIDCDPFIGSLKPADLLGFVFIIGGAILVLYVRRKADPKK